jgi:hypothetical protein
VWDVADLGWPNRKCRLGQPRGRSQVALLSNCNCLEGEHRSAVLRSELSACRQGVRTVLSVRSICMPRVRRTFQRAMVTWLFGVLAACSPSWLGPSSWTSTPCRVSNLAGHVYDDLWLGPPRAPSRPLPDAVVTILEGPGAGTSVVTDAGGGFLFRDLQLPGDSTLRLEARKEGWESHTDSFFIRGSYGGSRRCDRVTELYLGQPPHIFWGWIEEGGPHAGGFILIPGAKIEILDGPNQGAWALTDDTGVFQIDDLLTSGVFTTRASANGYQPRVDRNESLTRNEESEMALLRQ